MALYFTEDSMFLSNSLHDISVLSYFPYISNYSSVSVSCVNGHLIAHTLAGATLQAGNIAVVTTQKSVILIQTAINLANCHAPQDERSTKLL